MQLKKYHIKKAPTLEAPTYTDRGQVINIGHPRGIRRHPADFNQTNNLQGQSKCIRYGKLAQPSACGVINRAATTHLPCYR